MGRTLLPKGAAVAMLVVKNDIFDSTFTSYSRLFFRHSKHKLKAVHAEDLDRPFFLGQISIRNSSKLNIYTNNYNNNKTRLSTVNFIHNYYC